MLAADSMRAGPRFDPALQIPGREPRVLMGGFGDVRVGGQDHASPVGSAARMLGAASALSASAAVMKNIVRRTMAVGSSLCTQVALAATSNRPGPSA
jgi:hypothetical protein